MTTLLQCSAVSVSFVYFIHAEIFSCVSDSGQFIVCTEFGSFPGAIEGIHFELQRPKYFVNLYIV